MEFDAYSSDVRTGFTPCLGSFLPPPFHSFICIWGASLSLPLFCLGAKVLLFAHLWYFIIYLFFSRGCAVFVPPFNALSGVRFQYFSCSITGVCFLIFIPLAFLVGPFLSHVLQLSAPSRSWAHISGLTARGFLCSLAFLSWFLLGLFQRPLVFSLHSGTGFCASL